MTALITVLALALTPTHDAGQLLWTIDGSIPPEKSLSPLVNSYEIRDKWTDISLALTFDGPPPTLGPSMVELLPIIELPTEPPELAPPPRPSYVPPPNTLSDAQLDRLRFCESTNTYDINTGNGFYGAVQWLISTWNAAAARAGQHDWVGVRPDFVPAEIQDHVTRVWWASSNPRTQWPVCSLRVGAP